jgi:polysaccharide biosynthesis/export protein
MASGRTLRLSAPSKAIRLRTGLVLCTRLLWMLALTGCIAPMPVPDRFAASNPMIPREQCRLSLPPYRVAAPDILLIEAVYNIRPPDFRLRTGDQITVRLLNGVPLDLGIDATTQSYLQLAAKQPELQAKILNGPYTVEPDGAVDLGAEYGKVAVAGLTVDEAKTAIANYLHDRIGIREPKLSVLLTDLTGRQIVAGQHLVRPDGTVGLGIYGDVQVAGMTLAEVRQAVERHLSTYLNRPLVNVDVLAYNSKVYYIVIDGGGNGEQIVRLPCTGNETVLDAIGQINGLPQVSSKRIWIARPSADNTAKSQILKVNWHSLTADGIATTNYQLFPGDRIYVQADNLIATDNFFAKIIAPIERVFGVTLLGSSTIESLRSFQHGFSSGGSGSGGGAP